MNKLLRILESELFKYLLAGGTAFIIDFSVLMLLYKVFDVHYLKAAAIGLCMGLLTTYLLSIKWVFNNRNLSNKTAELVIFIAIGLVGFIINEVTMWISVEKLFLTVALSKIFATGIVFTWNFTIRKIILFK